MFALWFLYGFVFADFPFDSLKFLFGAFAIFLDLSIACFVLVLFFDLKIKNPKPAGPISEAVDNPEEYNLAGFLDFECAKAANSAMKLKDGEISSTHILKYLLEGGSETVNFIFARCLLNRKEIKEAADYRIVKNFQARKGYLIGDSFKQAIVESLKIASALGHDLVGAGDMLSALARTDEMFREILINAALKDSDVLNVSIWHGEIQKNERKRRQFWRRENLAAYGSLAKTWTAGYTITLDKYSIDITKLVKKRTEEIVGHRKEIEDVEKFLLRRKNNNVLLVGEPGTGKKNIIYNLAKKCLLGESLPEINYQRVVELDMPSLLARIENTEEAEAVLNIIFQEAYSAGNVILVISDFSSYIGEGLRPGIIDISAVLAPFLSLSQFRFVGITDYDGLHRNIERDSAFLGLFGKVEVKEMSKDETLMILEGMIGSLEAKHRVFVSYPAIREVVDLSERFMPALHFPEKAIELLDESVVYAASFKKDKLVLPGHVKKTLTEKTEIPTGEAEGKERGILLDMENLIHQRIINQNEAVKEISSALRRARSNISIRKGPMGTFLFLGPTGVGKTEVSKALAEIYFGSEKKIIRLDMSEFQSAKDITRLIGTEKIPGLLTSAVNETPFSLILLDEIEKSSFNIRNLFLQVLDEGFITDGAGRKISFQNTMIIATSNAGYKVILKAIESRLAWAEVKQKLLDYIFKERIFQPEFINRFDAFVVFSPLSEDNLMAIAKLMLGSLNKNLREKGIELLITDQLKKKIAELGYNPVFGAREMRRIIQEKIENPLAFALLKNTIARGNKIEINPETFKITVYGESRPI